MAGPIVSAPASSANLGPGFDTLGLALDLPFEVGFADDVGDPTFLVAEPTHPVTVAYLRAGGDERRGLVWRSPIPPGRGLGYSGAARVAGSYLGSITTGAADGEAADRAFLIAAELEGHADNAAASAYGGLCIAGEFGGVRVPTPDGLFDGLSVVVWSPDTTTSTNAARAQLPARVTLELSVHSIERTALWVAAMAGGRTELFRAACADELHQPARLVRAPQSATVLERLLDVPAVLAAWLSGSGPSVAALVGVGDSEAVVGSVFDNSSEGLPEGRVRVLTIAPSGVRTSSG